VYRNNNKKVLDKRLLEKAAVPIIIIVLAIVLFFVFNSAPAGIGQSVTSMNTASETSSAGIKVGEIVKWTKKVSLESANNGIIELPASAENITVNKLVARGQEVKIEPIISESHHNKLRFISWFRRLLGSRDAGNITLQLNGSAKEYVVEYSTEAPTMREEVTSYGKKVVISAPAELNYTNIVSFAHVPERVALGYEKNIKVRWVEKNKYVSFKASDSDGDGLIDYVEWITPNLPQQTFEIILISKAEHLDESRALVEDVFGAVNARDNSFAEIPAEHYLRVIFAEALTSSRDITIYAKSSSSGSVEVYEKDGTEKIADFGVIAGDGEYKVYLTNLKGSQDSFDLKVSGGSVEFDYVVDPYYGALSNYYGNGVDGAYSCTTGTCDITANKNYTSFTVSGGAKVNTKGNVIRISGMLSVCSTCSITDSNSGGAGGTTGTGSARKTTAGAGVAGGAGGAGTTGTGGVGTGGNGGGGGASGGTSDVQSSTAYGGAGGNGGAGGRGGGKVIIYAYRLNNTGNINANGSKGGNGGNGEQGGHYNSGGLDSSGGGGGAGGAGKGGNGGTVNLTYHILTSQGTVQAAAGAAGTAGTGGVLTDNIYTYVFGTDYAGGVGGNGGGGSGGGTAGTTAHTSAINGGAGTAATGGGGGSGGSDKDDYQSGSGGNGGTAATASAGATNLVTTNLVCGDTLTGSWTMVSKLACTGHGVTIGANNLVLDCAGFNIDGDGGSADYGVIINGRNNITIKNCNLTDFGIGVLASATNNSKILRNKFRNIVSFDVRLNVSAHDNIIDNNSMINGFRAADLAYAHKNNFTNNYISTSNKGFYVRYSNRTYLFNNTILHNDYGFNSDSTCYYTTIKNTTVDGTTGGTTGISLGPNSTVFGCRLIRNSQNLYTASNYLTANNNKISIGNYGIYSQGSYGLIYNNKVYGHSTSGIYFSGGTVGNKVYNNNFTNTINVVCTGTNYWNTTKTLATNIIGKAWTYGNYWSDYTGKDTVGGDWIGDTNLPWKGTTSITTGGDYGPLTGNSAPTHNTPKLNSTLGLNTTAENLTCYNQSTADADGNPVKNIYNWFVNNKRLAVLNTPFNSNNSAGAGKTKDYSGLGNNGTVTNAIWKSTGGYDGKGAYQFDGNGDYIDVPDIAVTNFTVSGWIKLIGAGTQGTQTPINMQDVTNKYFRIDIAYATPSVTLYTYTGSTAYSIGTTTISKNVWYHVAATRSGNVNTFYVNGVQKGTNTNALGTIATTNGFLGVQDTGGGSYTYYFNGTVDDVQIFNRSLSGAQIKALYQNKTKLIVSQELVAGDKWRADVTPNDGFTDGITKTSNNVTIRAHVLNITYIKLNATSANNLTSDNLTLKLQGNDNALHTFKNITNWFVNNKRMTVLNLPFESNNSGGAGKTKDYVLGNNGTVTNAIWNATAGHDGKGAYKFDGNGDYIQGSDAGLPVGTSARAFSQWFYARTVDAGSGYDIMGSYGNGATTGQSLYWGLKGGKLFIESSGLGCTPTGPSISTNTWHHFVATSSSATDLNKFTFYLDGALYGTGSHGCGGAINTVLAGASARYVSATGTNGLNGTIDDVQIFNRSLSPSQIKALYQKNTNLITSDETKIGDVWRADVIPNDGFGDGTKKTSNNITIGASINSRSVKLNSTSSANLTLNNLTAYVNATHYSGLPFKNITNWFVNNKRLSLLNMPFESNDGSDAYKTKDYSGLGYNGTVVNGTTWNRTGGHDGFGAYKFDGVNDYISVGDVGDGVSSLTMSAWIKPAKLHDGQIIAKDNVLSLRSFNFGITAAGKLLINIYGASGSDFSISDSIGYSAGSWTHVAVVYSNGVTTAYVNGVSTTITWTTDTASGAISNNALATEIGRRNYATTPNYFNGSIDDVQIFNRSLSAAQIKALYNKKTNRIVSNELTVGDKWRVEATPNDGFADGAKKTSNNVTILSDPPVINTYKLNATSANNVTSDNLTLWLTGSDLAGHGFKNITNWFANNKPLTLLNTPFESNNSAGAGKTKDYSLFKNNGTINGPTWNRTGGHDGFGAYKFDGVNDYISTGIIGNGTSSLTVSAWIKPAKAHNGTYIAKDKVISQRSFALGVTSAGKLMIYFYTAGGTDYSVSDSIGYTPGVWTHVAVVYSNGTTTAYVNGASTTITWLSDTASGVIRNYVAITQIGRTEYATTPNYFNGSIDDVQMFNRSLSAAQIKALYQNKTNKIVSNELTVGDKWRAEVTPNDGYVDGTKVTSNNVTILSHTPVISTVNLNATSANNFTSDNLTLWLTGSDPAGHAFKNITQWYVNNKPLAVMNVPFEGGSTSSWTKDYSSFKNNGTVNGGAVWNRTGGQDGFGAYTFDNVNDYISFGTSSQMRQLSAVAYTFWVKMPSGGGGYTMGTGASGGHRYGGVQMNLNNFYFQWTSTTPVSDTTVTGATLGLTADTWYHVAFMINFVNQTRALYINGQPVSTTMSSIPTNWVPDTTSSGYNDAIGGRYVNSWLYFNGALDDVQIFNRTLSSAQVKALYQKKTNKIIYSETAVGDKWRAEVTPNDGYSDGTKVVSNNITITADSPAISSIKLNATSANNVTSDNLTLWLTGSDPAGHAFKNITQWYVNSKPLVVLNMPFEAND
jgi:parallel beta-helix repeat protein